MVEITIMDNGSIRVSGTDIVLKDMNGKPIKPANPAQFSLCRCGHSANKPFCDGTHKTSNFQSKVSS
ncbi:MAG TPA: CDGSH iron-sulfur domain-containing protein [Planctomycetota bacterium]|nr:CDGSH iron-sulfur domain-containing protein [Planctomycetota bacterium]